MLPCVCSVINHRWRQNVVRIKNGRLGDHRVSLMFLVIYYWTNARQHGIYLFYTITKPTTTHKTFLSQNLSAKAGLCPLWRTSKKPVWRNLLSAQYGAISLVVTVKLGVLLMGTLQTSAATLVFDWQFESSKLQFVWASWYRFRAVFKYHLKNSLRIEILTVAYDG